MTATEVFMVWQALQIKGVILALPALSALHRRGCESAPALSSCLRDGGVVVAAATPAKFGDRASNASIASCGSVAKSGITRNAWQGRLFPGMSRRPRAAECPPRAVPGGVGVHNDAHMVCSRGLAATVCRPNVGGGGGPVLAMPAMEVFQDGGREAGDCSPVAGLGAEA